MKKFLVFGFFALFTFGSFYVFNLTTKDTTPEEISALYGGYQEFNYLSSGYLLNFTEDGGMETCGFTALSPNLGVTAGHCVENPKEIRLGVGAFSLDKEKHIQVLRSIQKSGWQIRQSREDDFAILNFPTAEDKFLDFAQIAQPKVGCNYKVVAYGRTENDTSSTRERLRKSAEVCITEIKEKTFKLNAGEFAGICFGDSGSSVFEEDTNNLVGVVASIVKGTSSNPESPCDYNNVAIGVRADINEDIISNNSTLPQDIQVSSNLQTIAVDDVYTNIFLDKRVYLGAILLGILLVVLYHNLKHSNRSYFSR